MAEVKTGSSVVATLLGDLVGSRQAPDRRAVHARLVEVLHTVNELTHPEEPIRVTVGDEFQGVFRRLGDALLAAVHIRLLLLPELDARFGLATGPVTQLDAHTQDGPAWWASREAIDWVRATAGKPATRQVRTAYRAACAHATEPSAVNAALLCRDQVMGSWDDRSIRIARGLLMGLSQRQLAQQEGISASAVSQRVRSDGTAVLLAAQELLAGLP